MTDDQPKMIVRITVPAVANVAAYLQAVRDGMPEGDVALADHYPDTLLILGIADEAGVDMEAPESGFTVVFNEAGKIALFEHLFGCGDCLAASARTHPKTRNENLRKTIEIAEHAGLPILARIDT